MSMEKNNPQKIKVNYQKILEEEIKNITRENKLPKLLIHSCCAPCSSYVLEYLSKYFKITIFYYNPNIHPEKEYRIRVQEQKDFIDKFKVENKVEFLEGNYEIDRFFNMAKGMEDLEEGGERCFKCYRMRLEETAKLAKERGFDYFTTTLSISPYKNAEKLNSIGRELEEKYGIKYLYSDFKKKNGYKRSIELSNEYGLYRQDYCGCVYSKVKSEERRNN
ncbi:epoxyqueuosine reductase QueH [Haloimpatiens lingqiaonensis]|uniref:epoxyqueuosine reductase QueH n=1 Tax=Haloimpatiens lingqiaonensis TaxID=1380675 RepID=UPI001FAB302F|nr:epoxyqueuosine reductase QueH [Haloimpatiens lingqiaonensis]